MPWGALSHRPVVSMQLCVVLQPPPSSSWTWSLLSTFLSFSWCLFHLSFGYCITLSPNRPLCFHYNPLCCAKVNLSAGRVSPLHTCSSGGIIWLLAVLSWLVLHNSLLPTLPVYLFTIFKQMIEDFSDGPRHLWFAIVGS